MKFKKFKDEIPKIENAPERSSKILYILKEKNGKENYPMGIEHYHEFIKLSSGIFEGKRIADDKMRGLEHTLYWAWNEDIMKFFLNKLD